MASNIDNTTQYMWTSASGLSALVFAVILSINFFYKYKFSNLRKLLNTDKGPPPWPIVGNITTPFLASMNSFFEKWHQQYGKVYAFFVGTTPCIMVSDPETIRQICIRDFDSFQNHIQSFFGFDDKYITQFIFLQTGVKWKRQRALLAPTFTTSKVRMMFNVLSRSADDLVKCIHTQIDDKKSYEGELKELNKQIVDTRDNVSKRVTLQLKSTYQLYTMNALASGMYAINITRQKDEFTINALGKRVEFIGHLLNVFDIDKLHTLLWLIVPESLHPYLLYERESYKSFLYAAKIFQPLIDERRNKSKTDPSKRYNDYLQILVDASLDDKMELSESDTHEMHHASLTRQSELSQQQKNVHDAKALQKNGNPASDNVGDTLSNDEILSNAIFMLANGLETTSVSLMVTTYALAMNQDIQERVYKEVKKIAKLNDDGTYQFDYDELTACEYLDAVIAEANRIHTSINWLDREANADYTIEGYNVHVPKGSSIFFLLQLMHRDPEYWPDPLKFDPERFMPQNRHKITPGSYMPWGQGPRHCIAMRFSLTEMKLSLAKITMSFKFTPRHDNVWPMKCSESVLLSVVNYCDNDVLVERR